MDQLANINLFYMEWICCKSLMQRHHQIADSNSYGFDVNYNFTVILIDEFLSSVFYHITEPLNLTNKGIKLHNLGPNTVIDIIRLLTKSLSI